MNNLSNAMENDLYNYLFRGQALAVIGTVYLALYTADPGEADTGTEVTGGGYARQVVPFTAPTDGAGTNSADVLFPVATADWGIITHIGLRTALAGGKLIMSGPLKNSNGDVVTKSIVIDDQFKMTAGQLAAAMR